MSDEVELGAAEDGLVPRVVGFDVGDKRIGVAVSDPLGYTAQPLFTLHRGSKRADLKAIGRVLRKQGATEAVVGNPLYMSGDQSPQAAKAQAFAEDLRTEFGITVHLWDERLTTTEAHRHLDEGGHARGFERRGIYRPGGGGDDSAGVVGGATEPAATVRGRVRIFIECAPAG